MTLIAAAGLDTFPVIFGDLVVSGVEHDGSPTSAARFVDSADVSTKSQWSIPTPDQKVVLLGDHCVVAWTGAAASARTLIDALRAMAVEAPLSIDAINEYLVRLGPAVDDVSLVGWVRERETFHQFWYRADIADSEMFGRVSAGGSGATGFVKLAAQISAGPVSAQGDAPAGLERAIASMLSATSLLLQAELSGQRDPLEHIGDGYEIATFVGDKFAKLGDIVFVWWKADVDGAHVTLSGPERIIKQDYAGELLLLHGLRMRPGKAAGDQPVLEEAKRVVAPFGAEADAERETEIAWPGMAATFTCHVVLVRTPTELSVLNQIEYSQTKTPGSIRFSIGDGSSPFGINQLFCEELTRSIHSAFASR